ncbi:MAG TPA: ATP-binding protein, partial [bacterium]
ILRNEPLLTAVTKILNEGNKETGEFEYFVSSKKIFLNYEVTPFFISEEKVNGALIQLQDITELKRLEAIRRDFVANASHELKTPLTAIVGYTETLLERSEDPASRIKFLRKIREQAQRLDFLIADLLKLSEIEREQPLELKACSLPPIIQETIQEFKGQAQGKNIDLAFDAPENINVIMNEESIRSVFNNLVDNAIKYTPQNGKISIRVTAGKNQRVKIEVIDTGIGIDPKYHERIFQRFYRIDKARSWVLGGTGLGLAIVKHIIERHGSKILMTSEVGKGSNFWFELQKG